MGLNDDDNRLRLRPYTEGVALAALIACTRPLRQ